MPQDIANVWDVVQHQYQTLAPFMQLDEVGTGHLMQLDDVVVIASVFAMNIRTLSDMLTGQED